jgi:signal transduction histidine kinase
MGRFATGLRTRIILTYLAIFLVSAAIMAGLAGWFYSRSALDNAFSDLEGQAFVAASALERPLIYVEGFGRTRNTGDLEILAERFAQDASSQISVVDTRGDILATSLAEAPANQGGYPEIVTALAGRIGHDVRWDPMTRQMMLYAAAPVRRLGRPLFVVQMSRSLATVNRQINRFWLSLGLTALLAALVAALAGWWLADGVVRPVLRLRNAASHLAAGQLDERVSERESGRVIEIGQLAAAFNHMAERIQAMLDRQRAFVADASHELRTPLTNIKLRAEALANGALAEPAVASRFVGEIECEADRMSRMAHDLLTLSRQDAAPPPFRERVDPAAIVDEALTQMALRAEKNGVALNRDVAPGLPTLQADPVGLRVAIVNLLDNALQYTPRGGQVTMRARADEQHVILQVADTGVGIPPEDLPHIFERFYRADKARSRRTAVAGSGAGLGLAIVRGIVEEHGGAVVAESGVGQGTTITVTLPCGP